MAAGYSLFLYCDAEGCSRAVGGMDAPAEFTGETFTGCVVEARRDRWRLPVGRKFDVFEGPHWCPDHASNPPATRLEKP